MVSRRKFNKIKKENPESRIGKREWKEQESRNDLAKVLKSQRKIKEKIQEKERQLPKIDEFCEKYCLNKIKEANLLSDVELQFVKQGLQDSNFHEICRHGNVAYEDLEDETKEYLSRNQKGVDYLYKNFDGSPLSTFRNLSNKLIDRLKTLPEDERLVCALYLSRQGVIICGRDSMGKFFDFGFYYTDMESERCDWTIGTIKKLGFDKYVKYVGDSCYRIREEDVIQPIIDKKTVGEVGSIKGKIDVLNEKYGKLDEKKKNLYENLEEYEIKREALEKYGEPVERALDILAREKGIKRKKDMKIDKGNNTYVILSEYSSNSGSAGMEYGITINVKRGSNTTKKFIKYRDPYDYRQDDWSKNYDKIEDVRIEGDKVFVTVSSSKATDTYEFDISEGFDNEVLDKQAQKEFKIRIKKEIERLIKENTKSLKYMATNDLDLMKTPGANSMVGSETEFSYDKAKVINREVDLLNGIAYIEIKAQTDASGAEGKEYALIKYEITPTGTREVDRRYFRQR